METLDFTWSGMKRSDIGQRIPSQLNYPKLENQTTWITVNSKLWYFCPTMPKECSLSSVSTAEWGTFSFQHQLVRYSSQSVLLLITLAHQFKYLSTKSLCYALVKACHFKFPQKQKLYRPTQPPGSAVCVCLLTVDLAVNQTFSLTNRLISQSCDCGIRSKAISRGNILTLSCSTLLWQSSST